MKWHEGLKKWVGYGTAIPVIYAACRFLQPEMAKIFCEYAFRIFGIFVLGDVVAEHIIAKCKWFNGKNENNSHR
jgi:hypothetical protein